MPVLARARRAAVPDIQKWACTTSGRLCGERQRRASHDPKAGM